MQFKNKNENIKKHLPNMVVEPKDAEAPWQLFFFFIFIFFCSFDAQYVYVF